MNRTRCIAAVFSRAQHRTRTPCGRHKSSLVAPRVGSGLHWLRSRGRLLLSESRGQWPRWLLCRRMPKGRDLPSDAESDLQVPRGAGSIKIQKAQASDLLRSSDSLRLSCIQYYSSTCSGEGDSRNKFPGSHGTEGHD